VGLVAITGTFFPKLARLKATFYGIFTREIFLEIFGGKKYFSLSKSENFLSKSGFHITEFFNEN
jgi:hypothetical protein